MFIIALSKFCLARHHNARVQTPLSSDSWILVRRPMGDKIFDNEFNHDKGKLTRYLRSQVTHIIACTWCWLYHNMTQQGGEAVLWMAWYSCNLLLNLSVHISITCQFPFTGNIPLGEKYCEGEVSCLRAQHGSSHLPSEQCIIQEFNQSLTGS